MQMRFYRGNGTNVIAHDDFRLYNLTNKEIYVITFYCSQLLVHHAMIVPVTNIFFYSHVVP
jgi:hypothetical protein